MHYLAKFCRICVRTGVKLLDIDTIDFDSIKFSEKLEICMKMVVNRESLSSHICLQCVKKLRISYDFQKMVHQSSRILQGYLTELMGTSGKIDSDGFVNSELRVTLTPLCKSVIKRKRITKEERCSLLKKLLMSTKRGVHKQRNRPLRQARSIYKGGLRNIIDFTKNFDFGYKIDKNHNCALSPLGNLVNFTNNFFLNDFADFRNTILYIIENKDSLYDSDEDGMFDEIPAEPELVHIKCEELVVEPDFKIKTELDYEENDSYSANYYVETSYSDTECKKENMDAYQPSHIKQESSVHCQEQPSNSIQMLDRLIENLRRKPFSHHSVRCRTRGNPYISPQLKQQFQMRSFQCDKCNRYFKSPGYLKAHTSKVHI